MTIQRCDESSSVELIAGSVVTIMLRLARTDRWALFLADSISPRPELPIEPVRIQLNPIVLVMTLTALQFYWPRTALSQQLLHN
jgi:hypothetical protein